MSKYYKADDIISFLNMNCPKDMWEYQIADLPTIEVSEDKEIELGVMLNGSYKLGFEHGKQSVEVSEDAISRAYAIEVLSHVKKDEQWRTECIDNEIRLIKLLPSVIPKPKEGEWKITNTYKDHSGRVVDRVEHTDCGYIWNREMGEPLHNYCPNCGARLKGAE